MQNPKREEMSWLEAFLWWQIVKTTSELRAEPIVGIAVSLYVKSKLSDDLS